MSPQPGCDLTQSCSFVGGACCLSLASVMRWLLARGLASNEGLSESLNVAVE